MKLRDLLVLLASAAVFLTICLGVDIAHADEFTLEPAVGLEAPSRDESVEEESTTQTEEETDGTI